MAMAAAPPERSWWTHFGTKAEQVGARVLRAESEQAAASLLRTEAGQVVATASLAEAFPAVAAAAAAAATTGDQERLPAEVAVLGRFAVAETGSVAVDEPARDRRLCFLAERLWVLVAADQLVPNIELALQRIGALIQRGSHHPLLMTGPSRTADIERVLTVGVHGPRRLVVVVVGT